MAYKYIEDSRKAVKKWKKRNKGRVLDQQKRYRERVGAEELARRLREWRKEHPDKVKQYRKTQMKRKRMMGE